MAETAAVDITKRYVNKRETIAFILYDIADSLSTGDFERFNTDVLKMRADLFTLANFIVGIWDIVNDTFTGIVVDKTRSRFGKFKPYLLGCTVPAATVGLLKWVSCYFLPTDEDGSASMFKFFFILFCLFMSETIQTFKGVAHTGLLATMTPNPDERIWLTARAKQLSAVVDNIPGILVNLVYDLMLNKKINMGYKGFYSGTATIITLVSVSLSLYFFLVVRERVVQSPELPHLKDGFRTIFRNRPMRVILLSEFLGAFSVSVDKNDYYTDVLNMRSFGTLTEVPAAPLSVISYGFINGMRKKFSNKTLWILTSHMDSLINIASFLFGIIGGTGEGGWYNKKMNMFFILFPAEFVRKAFWGVRNVIPSEVLYESIDYCEWQDVTGIRNEGIILTAKGLMTKLVSNTTISLKAWIKSLFGYDYYTQNGVQSQKVKFSLFMLSFMLPAAMSLLSVIPKFFYNITPEVREQMYLELQQRREERVLGKLDDTAVKEENV